MTLDELLATAEVKYRQVDHWATNEILRVGNPGPGNPRVFTPQDAKVAKALGRLTRLNCPMEALRAAANVIYDEADPNRKYWVVVEALTGQFKSRRWVVETAAAFLFEYNFPAAAVKNGAWIARI